MSIEVDLGRIATALEALLALQSKQPYVTDGVTAGTLLVATAGDAKPATKPRGRPAKGEENGVATKPAESAAVSATETAAPAAAEPAAAPKSSLDDVRNAAKAYGAQTSQADAVALMKKISGAESLGTLEPKFYDAVVDGFKSVTKAAEPMAPVVEDDPFAVPAAVPPKTVTVEEVSAALKAANKRAGTAATQAVLKEHGGVGADGAGGQVLHIKFVPATSYAALIAAANALPATK